MQNINKLFLLLILTLAGSSLRSAEQKAGGEVKLSKEEQDNLNNRFLLAAKNGNEKEVTDLLDKVDVNIQGVNGDTALMLAAEQGHENIINLLLKYGARIDIKNSSHGYTALMAASAKGHKDMVQMLIKNKAYLDGQSKDGETALIFASQYGHHDLVELLLVNGANPDIQDEEGYTALIWAARSGRQQIADAASKSEYDYIRIISKLCEYGANPNLKDKQNNSALKNAQLFGSDNIAKQIKTVRADYNTYYNLYKQSVSPECSGAMNFGQFRNLTLDEQGAKINEKLQKEIKISKEEQDKLNERLISAVCRGDIKRVAEFIVGADVNALDEFRNTALLLASDKGYVGIVKLLLINGANPGIRGEHGDTALIAAAYWRYVDIVNLLLNKRAKPDIQNADGDTALICAASLGYSDIVNLLLIYGADPDILNNNGHTALMIAVDRKEKNIVETLLKYGARPDLGHVLCGDKEIQELIKKYAEYYSKYHAQYEQYKLSAVNSLNASITGITGMTEVIAPIVTGYSGIMNFQEFIDWKLEQQGDEQAKITHEPAAAAAQRATLSDGQAQISAFDLGIMLVDQPEEAREYILRLLALNKITGRK